MKHLKYIVLLFALELAGCASAPKPAAPAMPVEQIEWQGDDGRLSMSFPSNWHQRDESLLSTPPLLLLAGPNDPNEDFVDSFSIQNERIPDSVLPTQPADSTRPADTEIDALNAYVKSGMDQFKDAPNLHFVDNSPVTIDGRPARRMLYAAYGKTSMPPWFFAQYVMLHDTRAFVLTFTFGSQPKYNKSKATVEQMVQSVRWHEGAVTTSASE